MKLFVGAKEILFPFKNKHIENIGFTVTLATESDSVILTENGKELVDDNFLREIREVN